MRYVTLAIIAIASASCASRPTAPPAVAQVVKPSQAVIVRIVSRENVIVVRTGANGPIYSSESTDGKILTGEMTLAQLAASNPAMFHTVKTMEANVLWAGE